MAQANPTLPERPGRRLRIDLYTARGGVFRVSHVLCREAETGRFNRIRYNWYWLADLCLDEDIPFVLGHALYLKAIHGGKTKSDPIDREKLAMLLNGGNFPTHFDGTRRGGIFYSGRSLLNTTP